MNEEEKEIIQRIQQDSTFRERSLLRIIEKQQTTINTMQAEFERLEDLEDNTDMLKMELKKKDKIIELMAKYMAEEFAEYQLDNIYAELYNCNGMERNWTRGKEEEVKDIKRYFNQKIEKGE